MEQQVQTNDTFWFVNMTVLYRNPLVRGALTLTGDVWICHVQCAGQTYITKYLALGACKGGSWSRAVTAIPEQIALPMHVLCGCRYGAWMNVWSPLLLDVAGQIMLIQSPSQSMGCQELVHSPWEKQWCCLKPEQQFFPVLDHGWELISDVRASSELCLNILKMHSFTWKALTRLTQCDKCLVVTLPIPEKSASLAGNQGNGKNVKNSLFQVGKQSENLLKDCGWEEYQLVLSYL